MCPISPPSLIIPLPVLTFLTSLIVLTTLIGFTLVYLVSGFPFVCASLFVLCIKLPGIFRVIFPVPGFLIPACLLPTYALVFSLPDCVPDLQLIHRSPCTALNQSEHSHLCLALLQTLTDKGRQYIYYSIVFYLEQLSLVLELDVLVAVVVVLVVASEGRQRAQTDGVGEEDLGTSVHPHLQTQSKHQ